MSFVDEDAEQSMFDEYHELQDEAHTQLEHAASLLTPDIIGSPLQAEHSAHSYDINQNESDESAQDNLATTSDLFALQELLDIEEPEEETEEAAEQDTTSSLFDRLMKQDNSIFVSNEGLPQASADKAEEVKVTRNPLTEEETPPWDSHAASSDEVEASTIDKGPESSPHVQEIEHDEDEISFDDDDDAPFEKQLVAADMGTQSNNVIEGFDSPELDTTDAVATPEPEYTSAPMHKHEPTPDQLTDFHPAEQSYEIHQSLENTNNVVVTNEDGESKNEFVDTADEIAAMFGHGVNDLRNVEVTHPKVAPYLDNGDKLIRAKQINKWSDFIEELGVGGLNKQLLLQANLVQHGENFVICIDERNKHLDEEQHRVTITDALTAFYQKPVTFKVEYGVVQETPFQIQQQISLVRKQHAQHVVNTNDSIQELIKAFEGRVIEGSIKPR